MIPIVFESLHPETPKHGYWDYNLLEKLVKSEIWSPANELKFQEYEHIQDVPEYEKGLVLVFPARYHLKEIQEINKLIAPFEWAVVLVVNDEEGLFPTQKLKHPNMKVWVMTPRIGSPVHGTARFIGEGFPPDAKMLERYTELAMMRPNDWYFAGQITTPRRVQMSEQLEKLYEADPELNIFLKTDGFTKGFKHEDYYKYFAMSKVAICPTGAVTPDSFRLYEALEAGCIPIADDVSSVYESEGFFKMLYPDAPFPILTDYADLPGYIDDALKRWAYKSNRIYAWWQQYKRKLVYNLQNDIYELSGKEERLNKDIYRNMKDAITVVIPTSPIKTHPSTVIIDETIKTIRTHLPDSEIIITFDGVRLEQTDRQLDYDEFTRRMLWKCNFEYKNVLPIIFDEHTHQVGMMRAILDEIKTPLILYAENDTPLTPDLAIEWEEVVRVLLEGQGDVVRFHFESHIPEEHEHMMLGYLKVNTVGFMKTSQWSQRPHVASVAFYRRILENHFSPNAKSFIEDKMHGVVSEAVARDSLGWNQYKILIYHPLDGNIKRSYHTDGRAGEEKYDDKQVF